MTFVTNKYSVIITKHQVFFPLRMWMLRELSYNLFPSHQILRPPSLDLPSGGCLVNSTLGPLARE